jgi:hypothetical protein
LLTFLVTPNVSALVTNLLPDPEGQEERDSSEKQHQHENDYPVKDGKFTHTHPVPLVDSRSEPLNKAISALACSKVALDGPPFPADTPTVILAKKPP